MNFPTHIVSAGGIGEEGQGNTLLSKTQYKGWVYSVGIILLDNNLLYTCYQLI